MLHICSRGGGGLYNIWLHSRLTQTGNTTLSCFCTAQKETQDHEELVRLKYPFWYFTKCKYNRYIFLSPSRQILEIYLRRHVLISRIHPQFNPSPLSFDTGYGLCSHFSKFTFFPQLFLTNHTYMAGRWKVEQDSQCSWVKSLTRHSWSTDRQKKISTMCWK